MRMLHTTQSILAGNSVTDVVPRHTTGSLSAEKRRAFGLSTLFGLQQQQKTLRQSLNENEMSSVSRATADKSKRDLRQCCADMQIEPRFFKKIDDETQM